MSDEQANAGETTTIIPCPKCGGQVEATLTDRPQVVDCPHCSVPFVIPARGQQVAVAKVSSGDEFVVDDTGDAGDDEAAARRRAREDLDGLKIRRIAARRRAAYRSRSYQLIGAALCLVGAGQCLYNVYRRSMEPGDNRTVAYLIVFGWMALAAVGVVFGLKLLANARLMKEEAERSELMDPNEEPDFTPLSDGSQRWKNLGGPGDDDRDTK